MKDWLISIGLAFLAGCMFICLWASVWLRAADAALGALIVLIATVVTIFGYSPES